MKVIGLKLCFSIFFKYFVSVVAKLQVQFERICSMMYVYVYIEIHLYLILIFSSTTMFSSLSFMCVLKT